MTQEEAVKYLQQLYPNDGHCWLDEQRIDAINMAIKALQEEPVSKDLEEAADKHLVEKGYLLTTNNGEHLAEVEAKSLFKAGAQWQKEQLIDKACNYLFSHMGLFVTFFDDDIVEDIEKSEFIKKFRIAMEDKL